MYMMAIAILVPIFICPPNELAPARMATARMITNTEIINPRILINLIHGLDCRRYIIDDWDRNVWELFLRAWSEFDLPYNYFLGLKFHI